MLYKEELKNKVSQIISYTTLGWQQTGILCDCLQDRYEIEIKYSKAIEKLATKLAPVNEFFSASFGIRAQLSFQFADEIKGEIANLKSLIVQQKATQHVEYMKLWENQLQSIKSDLKSAETYLKNRKKEYEIEGTLELIYLVSQPEKVEKQKNNGKCQKRISISKRKLQGLEKQEAEISLDQIQQLNLQRLNTIKECILRLFIHESSIAKNYLYDLEKMSERLHDQDQNQLIEEFIKKTKQQEINSVEFDSFLSKLVDLQGQQQIKTSNIYPVGLEKTEEQIRREIQELQKSPQKQEEYFNFLFQKSNSSAYQLTLQEFAQCTHFTLGILDQCFESKNAVQAQKLLQYSFGLYTKDIQTRYMQDELLNHHIWQFRDYWEAVVIHQISKIKQQQSKDAINASILIILTQISQYMLMFKLQPDVVRDMVEKFSQYFKLSKDIADDLIIAISSQL